MGRVIEAEDDQPGRPRVAVISDQLWHSMFGGDAVFWAKLLQLNREFYQIVGVMPPAFSYPHKTDFLTQTAIFSPRRFSGSFRADGAAEIGLEPEYRWRGDWPPAAGRQCGTSAG